MEKKIGIVTLHGYTNYGNRLQNYALKFFLQNMGFKIDSVIIKKPPLMLTTKEKIKLLKQKINYKFKEMFSKNIQDKKASQVKREAIFKSFSTDLLNEAFYDLKDTEDLNSLSTYSFFVTGSDQVWHPAQFPYMGIYFLAFADKSKRIAYAPSISSDSIPEHMKSNYKKYLLEMSSLSIREKKGSHIIKELIGYEVPVLVDPTMLLSKEEWLQISKKANNRPQNNYILTYFLGGPSDETKEMIEKIANEKNMKVINLGDIDEKSSYETGPREFIDYINNASAFFTDSFHGVVFSIILQTPFIVFERKSKGFSMYSRIDTLLEMFDMKNREVNGFEGDIFSMDFTKTIDVLQEEKEKSLEYFINTLHFEE